MMLHDACFSGNLSALEASLNQGAMVNEAQETAFSNACSTPLHIASMHGHSDCVTMLLKGGADSNLTDCWGHTAAHLAAQEGNCDVLQVLLENNTSVLNMMDEQERTPLHVAAQGGHTDCIRVMLGFGAHAETVYMEQDEHTVPLASAIHSAAATGNTEALKMLLDASSRIMVDAPDSFDRTALHLAASNGHVDCVKVLLEAGASATAKNTWGASALHLAARKKSPEIMQLLLESGADVNSADNHSMSALHYASQAACLSSMQLLVANKAAVNTLSSLRETPLSLVVQTNGCNAPEAISLLLSAGASLSCLRKMFGALDPSAKALLQEHVRRTSLATAASVRAFSARLQETKAMSNGGVVQPLCSDVLHMILGRAFDVEEEFLRILLNGDAEGHNSWP